MPKDVRWHFIGHLQSNKTKALVGELQLPMPGPESEPVLLTCRCQVWFWL